MESRAIASAAVLLLVLGACAESSGGGSDLGGDAVDEGGAEGAGDVEGDGGDGDADDDAEGGPDIDDGDAPDGDEDGGADGDEGDAGDAGDDGADLPDDGGPPPRECVDERCGDGLDNDCDGEVDEDCYCLPGEVAPCFSGDPRRRGFGVCRDGLMFCEGTGEFGLWSACGGEDAGGDETCDAAALDEDCDGAPNDGCDCSAGDPDLPCGSDEGECRGGTQRCLGGTWSECLDSIGPRPEDCNTLDDDCDRTSDEGLFRVCGSDVGACRTGYEVCSGGAWGSCEGGHVAGDEVCDDLDNDCDTATDEDVSRPCGITQGRCIAGVETCAAGAFGACEGAVDPIGELCNGVDDDCDTDTDEGLVRACGTDEGVCVAGTETCAGATGWGACSGAVLPGTEACDGVLDEDCDGAVDEGCTCISGATRPCGTDEGACVAGNQLCDTSGAWGACTGSVGPAPEECNLLDDDCDAATDEGCDCVTGATRTCGTDVGECVAGRETCDGSGRWGPCTGGVIPTAEVCDGADNDCDGGTDEGGVCPSFPPDVTCPGGRTVVTGTAVVVAGAGSDPDGGPVTFVWSVVTRPTGSTANPAPADASTATFTPDRDGGYTLRLCVTDDELDVSCCTVSITATPACTPPATPALTTCPTSWDRRPIVEFDALPAGIAYELYKDSDATPYATVATTGQNYFRPPSALGAGGPPPGGTTTTIYLRACRASDPTCCAVTAPVSVALIEACTTPIAPTTTNVLFSEYVINGDGTPCPSDTCEAGEAIEITNLSNCPVTLNGYHFGYQNPTGSTFRWMNFGAADVIPPRGVYVAIRNQAASACSYPFFGPDDPALFGLRISALAMQGTLLTNGWFVNTAGGSSTLRLASGAWVSITGGTTIDIISPYLGTAGECESIGFDAVDQCGNISAVSAPTTVLAPNQLGRLWHPCDAVVAPSPASCR
ncbi:MAG: lamin tail domain-containing protein [Deltaproteobacteria bacterium]|nr:lamin tail domain-containing protein [Deltaproteobacteria bacterium]